jgi:hypothetical protein
VVSIVAAIARMGSGRALSLPLLLAGLLPLGVVGGILIVGYKPHIHE